MVIVNLTFDPLRLYWQAVWESMRDVWFQIRNWF